MRSIKHYVFGVSLLTLAQVFPMSAYAVKPAMGDELQMPVSDHLGSSANTVDYEQVQGNDLYQVEPVSIGVTDEVEAANQGGDSQPAVSAPAATTVSETTQPAVNDTAQTQPTVTRKPAFTGTPTGQQLSPDQDMSEQVDATPTPNSEVGGYPGARQGKHKGLDSTVPTPMPNMSYDGAKGSDWVVPIYFTGTEEGTVTRSGPAQKAVNDSTYLGERVEVVFETEHGTYASKVMHMQTVTVKEGDRIQPGTIIGYGGGAGDQFASGETGDPHVHWEVRLNGVLINPLSGEKLTNQ